MSELTPREAIKIIRDKGVLRWLRFYEEIASIWAYEARKSREAIHALLEERSNT